MRSYVSHPPCHALIIVAPQRGRRERAVGLLEPLERLLGELLLAAVWVELERQLLVRALDVGDAALVRRRRRQPEHLVQGGRHQNALHLARWQPPRARAQRLLRRRRAPHRGRRRRRALPRLMLPLLVAVLAIPMLVLLLMMVVLMVAALLVLVILRQQRLAGTVLVHAPVFRQKCPQG